MAATYLGEFAALATAVCWTFTAIAFEASGKRIGSLAVNLFRLVIAFFFLAVFNYFRRGLFLPVDATGHQWFWLALSGILGFTLGDMALFQAFVTIGARVSLLLMSLVPPLAALLSWIFLGESLGLQNFTGMCVTLLGISLVILGRETAEGSKTRGSLSLSYSWQGVVLAIIGALGQASGLVMSKHGMQDYNPFEASQIRVLSGIIGFALLFSFWKKWGRVTRGLKDSKAIGILSIGAFFGPFLGVSFSLMAVQHANTGVASTIMALTPVLIIPFSVWFFSEKLKWKEVIGAFLA
ncbi:MAG: DMT family transporter, partial [Bacteroidetes bacterium]|nr:DMT family transporter [Bacteroidota bacterium]